MKNQCICWTAQIENSPQAISADIVSNIECYITVNDKEAYLKPVCDECDCAMYIKLDYCPFCGRKFKNKGGGK